MCPFASLRPFHFIACTVVTIAMPLLCVADETVGAKNIDVAPQQLLTALQDFSEQSGLQVAYVATLADNVTTKGTRDADSAAAALSDILDRTGLEYQFVNADTVAIGLAVSTNKEAGDPGNARTTPSRVVLMAQASDRSNTSSRSENRDHVLEEIIVTAQRREERLQVVPISISVLRGDDLDRSTASGITEALSRVPGVSINEIFLGGGAQVPIRGVSAGLAVATGTSPTAYYLDSVPFGFVRNAFGPNPDVYDLERVEVLRGPQGTLYGASALNGVVRVLTMDADLDKFAIKARGLTSNTEKGDWNYRADMAVNVPIVEGKLAARAVLGYQDLSGWIDRPNNNNANKAERLNARFKLNAQPTEQLSIGLSAWLSRADYDAPSTGNDDERHSSLNNEPISTDYDAFGLKVGYEFPWFSVASITSYVDYVNNSVLDIVPGTDLGFLLETDFKTKTFAQEVIVNSTGEGAWLWSLGGIYRDSEDQAFQDIPGLFTAVTRFSDFSESYAVFGELTRVFLGGRLELTGGLRYFKDDVALREHSRLSGAPPDQLVSSESAFNATTPRLVLTWHPSEQMTAYASYSEGFRSGSIQPPAVLEVEPLPPVKPDKLMNYEMGAKGSLLAGGLNFETALYYIDWQDVQQSISVDSVGGTRLVAVLNGESASGLGFEIGATVWPLDRLELGVNFSWNDLTVDSEVISGGVVLFDKGDRLSFSPEYTVGASGSYLFPLGRNGFDGQFSASANYTSEQESRGLGADGAVHTVSDSMLIARTSFSIRAPDNWTATLFVDNVNNERGSPTRSTSTNSDWSIRVRPRTIGVQLDYRF